MNTTRLRQVFQAIMQTKLAGNDSAKLIEAFMKEVNSFAIVKEVSDATYVVKNEDLGTEIYCLGTCSVSFSPDLDDKFQCAVLKDGSGNVTFTGTYKGAGNTLATQYTGSKITKKGKDIYVLGNLTTV